MVSIIILSYNTRDLLKKCLESIFNNLKDLGIEIIVVDNASSDGSVQMVKNDFKKVNLIESKKNLGFSAGNNLGVKQAKGKFLLFLNSDIEILDNKLIKMVEFLNTNPRMGVVGGRLENPDGSLQKSYGSFYSLPEVFLQLFGGERVKSKFSKRGRTKRVDWVSGAFMLIKTDLFKKIKGFDEKIFMYTEDMELCYRVQKEGFKVYYYPDVKLLHLGQGSSNRTFAIVSIYKGILYFYKKHKAFWQCFIVKLLLTIKAFSAIIVGELTFNKYLTSTYKEALKF